MVFNRFRPLMNKRTKGVNDKAKTLYYSAKSRSTKYDIDFDLDVNWVKNNIAELKCQLTGLPLTLNYNNGNGVKYNSASIHRLIPELGYIKENCIIIANSVNMFISNHSIDDILLVNSYIKNNTNNILVAYNKT